MKPEQREVVTACEITTCTCELDTIIDKAAAQLGYDTVKPEQREVVNAFMRGNDVFASLPTGYGMSLCFAILPLVFDLVHLVGHLLHQ